MTLTLGAEPLDIRVELVSDADFVCTLNSSDGDWPVTAVITIQMGDIVWTATLAGADATFNIDKTEVNAAITAQVDRCRLVYTDGTSDLVWGLGRVIHRG